MRLESEFSGTTVPGRDRVLGDVKQIISEFVDVAADRIRETDDLLNDLGCDSLDIVEVTMELEEHFDISVPDELQERLRTVGGIADGVLQLLSQPQGG
ncbi:MAG: phosphopantetheine-binding protein [Thermoguttaceae bacterium]|jgi:acyl carrier protein